MNRQPKALGEPHGQKRSRSKPAFETRPPTSDAKRYLRVLRPPARTQLSCRNRVSDQRDRRDFSGELAYKNDFVKPRAWAVGCAVSGFVSFRFFVLPKVRKHSKMGRIHRQSVSRFSSNKTGNESGHNRRVVWCGLPEPQLLLTFKLRARTVPHNQRQIRRGDRRFRLPCAKPICFCFLLESIGSQPELSAACAQATTEYLSGL